MLNQWSLSSAIFLFGASSLCLAGGNGNKTEQKSHFAYRPQREEAPKAKHPKKEILAKQSKSAKKTDSVHPISADLLPSEPCPDHWRISGQFLYLLPTFDDTYFVFDSGISTLFPNGQRKNNDFGFNPGFRVSAEYAFCDTHRELQVVYSSLNATQNQTITGEALWGSVGSPAVLANFENYTGLASAKEDLMYQRIDCNFSQQALNSYGMYFYVQPGLEYAYLRLGETHQYQQTNLSQIAEIDQKSKSWGVGPQLGLSIDYNFFQKTRPCLWTHAFAIRTLFSGSLLMGRSQTYHVQTLNGAIQINTNDQHTWRTIPAIHAKIGLEYLARGSKVGFSLGVGYEFSSYIRGLARTNFSDNVAQGLCNTNYYNFDIQGLYVSGAISF